MPNDDAVKVDEAFERVLDLEPVNDYAKVDEDVDLNFTESW